MIWLKSTDTKFLWMLSSWYRFDYLSNTHVTAFSVMLCVWLIQFNIICSSGALSIGLYFHNGLWLIRCTAKLFAKIYVNLLSSKNVGMSLDRSWTSNSFDTLFSCDAVWRHKSGSTVACCPMAPSHYPNQCWPVIGEVEWHSNVCKFTRDTSAIDH